MHPTAFVEVLLSFMSRKAPASIVESAFQTESRFIDAVVNWRHAQWGLSLLHCAFFFGWKEYPDLLLAKCGTRMDINVMTPVGTPLFYIDQYAFFKAS